MRSLSLFVGTIVTDQTHGEDGLEQCVCNHERGGQVILVLGSDALSSCGGLPLSEKKLIKLLKWVEFGLMSAFRIFSLRKVALSFPLSEKICSLAKVASAKRCFGRESLIDRWFRLRCLIFGAFSLSSLLLIRIVACFGRWRSGVCDKTLVEDSNRVGFWWGTWIKISLAGEQ